jgi:hypothetical protein
LDQGIHLLVGARSKITKHLVYKLKVKKQLHVVDSVGVSAAGAAGATGVTTVGSL